MQVIAFVSGYLDWPPVPPGTRITPEDRAAKRVKIHADGVPHMRVRMPAFLKNDKGQIEHPHSIMLHEQRIVDRYAALAMLGKRKSREQVVTELAQSSFEHHLDPDHFDWIEVHDDGPNDELIRSMLLVKRKDFGFEHYRRFIGLQTDPDMDKKEDSATKKLLIDVWQLPVTHVVDEAKVATFGAAIASDTQLETIAAEYMRETATQIEEYLNVVFGCLRRRPTPTPQSKTGGAA